MADFTGSAEKMKAEGLPPAAIKAFENSFKLLATGEMGMIPEADISPASEVPRLEELAGSVTARPELLGECVMLKLNGGLGTSMGLDQAKSLLKVKGEDTFLDLIAVQVMSMREKFGQKVRFMLMNSFATSDDSMNYLSKYTELVQDDIQFVQNKVPKLDRETLQPASYEPNPGCEWCPPGHGDLYAALEGSGTLDKLLADGIKYMFVSNSDNLGAVMDLTLLTHFAESDSPFMMECADRTVNDKKGGHLAVRNADSQLILREAAMCPDEDEDEFQDISKHKFFNTNNLWIRLDKLREYMDSHDGIIPLPMISNKKTVNPKDESSTPVFQLETAMGAAIECFTGASAIVVPRDRFAPVKKCSDLLLLRSDAYAVVDGKIVLAEGVDSAPQMGLDSKKYKLVQSLEKACPNGTPSLAETTKFTVKGFVEFDAGNKFVGEVKIVNGSGVTKALPPGTYDGCTVDISANAISVTGGTINFC
mmetsp:Transcript_60149/g.165295  ORF Transcript_60149/g.165295 Transcript_60149/m.165295 type:complete len:478 (+) Transcript_60149:300-1733(+)|eukprot:CAMPEP_0119464686 /NCGR_PEP_ID=MMETSP1344-20130328/171_1 /TAXON_ID=236787 /ORGANISM="Florenciella parvula, Strain CCMP2471" /LENGTH=477 /DNA_ID=CAMNT_0007496915 /DNA_START=65 /DNA_END=1498 /DNA_ORIENTATION=+